jgi:hypothetical protein
MIESRVTSWFKQLDESTSMKHRPRENKPYVTISRQSGAYGTTIAEMLAEYLSKRERRRDAVWAIFDHELIKKVIDDNKFPGKYEKYFNEYAMPAIQDIMEDLLRVHPPHETLIRKMSETIFKLSSVGYVIVIGSGGNIITQKIPLKNVWHICRKFLVSPKKRQRIILSKRIAPAMNTLKNIFIKI